MRKGLKIILAVFLIIVLALGVLIYTQWNSIEAFIHSFYTTEEDTLRELEQNKEQLQEFIDKEDDISVRDLTAEESAALASGELSEDEVVKILTGQTPEPSPAGTQTPKPETNVKPSKTQSPTPKPTPTQTPSAQQKISELLAKLYVQKSTYLNKLDTIEANVRHEFLSQPKKWESKKAAKKELLAKYLPKVASWEKECDNTVYGIINEIQAELQKNGMDEAIVGTLKSSYLEEKKLKKTYFINRYMD